MQDVTLGIGSDPTKTVAGNVTMIIIIIGIIIIKLTLRNDQRIG